MRNQTTAHILGLLLLLVTASSAHSQTDSIFKRLSGTWKGDGKALGMPATLHISWDWVLGDKFLRLSLKNEMKAPDGQVRVFEGHAYYKPSEAKCEGTWFDSRGVSFPLKCSVEGQSLTAIWGTLETEQGKSVYSLVAGGKLEIVDSVMQKDGTWREFGRFVTSRVTNNQ